LAAKRRFCQALTIAAATYRGNEPVREWLKKLDAESRQIVGENIATAEFG